MLAERQKFTTEDPKGNGFKDKCLQRLFTLDEMREEDLKFKQRLLEEIQRHNQLLENLIVKIGRQ